MNKDDIIYHISTQAGENLARRGTYLSAFAIILSRVYQHHVIVHGQPPSISLSELLYAWKPSQLDRDVAGPRIDTAMLHNWKLCTI
jgi:hypothetical protein